MKQCTNPDCRKKYYLTKVSESVHGKESEEIICPHCNTLVETMKTDSFFMARKAEDLYKEKILGIASENGLVETYSKYEKNNDFETDTYWYDEVDSKGNVVGKYILKNSCSMSPVRKNNITFDKVG